MDQETFGLLRDAVRRFVEERLMPAEDRVEAENEVPQEIIAEMRAIKLARNESEAVKVVEWWRAWPNPQHETALAFVRLARALLAGKRRTPGP